MADKITQLQKELGTIIKGKKEVTDKIIMAVLARGHVLLEDVPGVGKTTTALALCRFMGMDFNRIQFTPDVVPSDVTGFTMYEKQTGKFIYRPGAVMCTCFWRMRSTEPPAKPRQLFWKSWKRER